jgi:hypothetical protein
MRPVPAPCTRRFVDSFPVQKPGGLRWPVSAHSLVDVKRVDSTPRHTRPVLSAALKVEPNLEIYLQSSMAGPGAVAPFSQAAAKGAAAIAQRLAAMGAGREDGAHAAKFSLSPAPGHGMATR